MASNYRDSVERPFLATFDASVSAAANDNDLTHRYCIVKRTATTNNSVDLATSATDAIAGVLAEYNVGANTECVVVLSNASGTYKVKAGGTVHVGDSLTTDSASHAIATTTTGNVCFGAATQEAVAGDVFEYEPRFFFHL